MNNHTFAYLALFLLSASILCFEIVSTRIASVIFVQDYAFIILSLALLGIGGGGVFSYIRIKTGDDPARILYRLLFALGASLCVFTTATTALSITNPFVFLFLLFLPFFASGVAYAQIYKSYSTVSFRLYASDLSGAAVGSVGCLGLIGIFGAPNSVMIVALVVFTASALFLHPLLTPGKRIALDSILILSFVLLLFNGRNEILGMVPIGNFPEKDYYHVYPHASATSTIIDSRWSMYGRSDLVQYSNQDMVRQLFVDGAAGTQVYRFNGDIQNTQSNLQELLLRHTNSVPFLCMTGDEKRSMLVIGPGGGKEILSGLFGEVDSITGVEVNPDFVRIVKDHKGFDGGIYTDFPNVKIVVEEGRHFVRQTSDLFDLIVMALPSTEQMQNIEPLAANENFLLTREAIEDYLKKVTSEGRLILTVHNEWELMRLIVTAVSVFQDMGVSGGEIKNHFAVFEAEYAPTVIIKKNAFTPDEALRWEKTCAAMPRGFPTVSYLPFGVKGGNPSPVNRFLEGASHSAGEVRTYIRQSKNDIAPCTDDKPYFYKRTAGIPDEYLWLLAATMSFAMLVVWLPLRFIRRRVADRNLPGITLPLAIFICIGTGFMVLEVSLFQRLVLYLGSPTISLSILLSSLLVGMGTGSYLGRNIYGADVRKRLFAVSIAIVLVGILFFVVSPLLFTESLTFEMPLRAATTFLAILPLALLLGIPFPSCIQLLAIGHNDRYIPWMYGVNGSLSVLGSVLAAILSMLYGFTPAYFAGLFFYLSVSVISFSSWKRVHSSSV